MGTGNPQVVAIDTLMLLLEQGGDDNMIITDEGDDGTPATMAIVATRVPSEARELDALLSKWADAKAAKAGEV